MVWGRCIFALIVCSSVGCMAKYSMRPVDVVVTNPKTNEPIANVPVSVGYSFFKVPNPPQQAEGTTDENGRVVLQMADFDRGIHLTAGGNWFYFDALRVRGGGSLKRWEPNSDKTQPEVAVRLVPFTSALPAIGEKSEKLAEK